MALSRRDQNQASAFSQTCPDQFNSFASQKTEPYVVKSGRQYFSVTKKNFHLDGTEIAGTKLLYEILKKSWM